MIALVDCDNFFASCERLFRPDLQGKPVAVLSNNDGCIIARSNEVKALNIPMGVPYFKAKEELERHKATVFSGNFTLYSNISQRILSFLAEHVPQIEVYSIDEAFLNLQTLAIADVTEWSLTLKQAIQKNIGIPVSIGVAPTKTLAKLASHYAKKHHAHCILDPERDPAMYRHVLEATPVGEMWGVGRQLNKRFAQAGIHTVWHLSQTSETWLRTRLGINGSRMYRELRGECAYPFEEAKAPCKSLIASRSFGHTIGTIHELETAVASFASQAAFRLRKHRQAPGLFGVYLRSRTSEGEHQSQSKIVTLAVPTNDTSELVSLALACLRDMYDSRNGYKKAGVFAYHLQDDSFSQLSLFDKKTTVDTSKRKNLMKALDSINKRFGGEVIHVASIDVNAKQWHAQRKWMSPAYTTEWSQIPSVYPA